MPKKEAIETDRVNIQPRTKPSNILSWAGQDLTVLILMSTLCLGLVWSFGASIRVEPASIISSILFFAGMVVSIFFLRWLRLRGEMQVGPEFVSICRDWFPFSILLLIYENLSHYTGFIQPDVFDALLAEMEVQIWSVQPTIWLEAYINPVLVDLMSVAYAFHFPLPSAIAVGLYVFTKRAYFREFATAIIFCNLAGFILYFIFPSGPPRFYLDQMYTVMHLPSYTGLYTWSEQLWDDHNPVIVHSSFPSLHVAYSTIAMIFAYRRDHWPESWRIIGPVVTIMTICLWISTIYLRHHWTLDIISGAFLGGLSIITARYLTLNFGGNTK